MSDKPNPSWLFPSFTPEFDTGGVARVRLPVGQMMVWRPIDTAPKDGTWILVWEQPQTLSEDGKVVDCPPGAYNPGVHVVRWAQYAGYDDGEYSWMTIATGPNPDCRVVEEASHWMNLPSPPEVNP